MVHIHFFNGLHKKSTQFVNTKQFCSNISPQVLSTSYCPINNTLSSQPFGLHTVNNTKFWDRQTDQVSWYKQKAQLQFCTFTSIDTTYCTV
jgi:hypothetical protein